MKKVIAFFAIVIVATVFSAEAAVNEIPPEQQIIVTDCGTVHPIPADSSVEYACNAVEVWSNTDCYKRN